MNQKDPQREFRTAQDPWYPYQNTRVRYRSEPFFISDPELATLNQWLANDNDPQPPSKSTSSSLPKLIFDTDIGTDIDDALALLMLLHTPNNDYRLLGITTVYGFSHVRAAVTERIVRAYEQSSGRQNPIPVIPGESTPLGTHRPVWHTGTEGLDVLSDDEIESLEAKADFVVANGKTIVPISTEELEGSRHKAARFIIEQSLRYPGELIIIGLGALTNVAMALAIDPDLSKRVKRLVFMGLGRRISQDEAAHYQFPVPKKTDPIQAGLNTPWIHYPNHNVSADVLAAVRVFQSGMPIDVVPHAVTGQMWWGRAIADSEETVEIKVAKDACLSLMKATAPKESVVVSKLLNAWLEYRSVIFRTMVQGTCPHDALTTAEAVYPGRYVQFSSPGQVMIHEWAGFATFVAGRDGPHRLATSLASLPFLEFLSDALMPEESDHKIEEVLED